MEQLEFSYVAHECVKYTTILENILVIPYELNIIFPLTEPIHS